MDRDGKGKEYYDASKLKFGSEFKNKVKWNGKGKEYNKEDELIFEGEYKNGKRWNGKGKKYYYGFELRFEYLNGKKIRKGKENEEW